MNIDSETQAESSLDVDDPNEQQDWRGLVGRRRPRRARSPIARKQRRLLVGVIAWAVASTAGLAASTLVKSPQQLAAESAPPPPKMVLAPVERRVLADTIVMRGAVVVERTATFTPAAIPGADLMVVTRAPKHVGDALRAGDVVVEVSGRPVFALTGAFPAYRDLAAGDAGPDVAQLQRALLGAGLSLARVSGVFDIGTQRALEGLYSRGGYAAPRLGGGAAGKRSELFFVPALPATVTGFNGSLGSEIVRPLVTVAVGAAVIRGRANPEQARLIRRDMAVTIDIETEGTRVTGSVVSVQPPARDETAGGRYSPIVIRPDKPIDPRLEGSDVRVKIETARTKTPVLIVPIAAIYLRSDANSYVDKVGADDLTEHIRVRVGVSAGGYAEVTPEEGRLSPGDRVIVSR